MKWNPNMFENIYICNNLTFHHLFCNLFDEFSDDLKTRFSIYCFDGIFVCKHKLQIMLYLVAGNYMANFINKWMAVNSEMSS